MPIPSQAEYERREIDEARRKVIEVERAPLAERKEACADFFEAMRDRPELIAERIGWLLAGNYGYGSMILAKQVLKNRRMNRPAALTQMIATYEWMCPPRMAVEAWKRLTSAQKEALQVAVEEVIADAEASD